MPRHTTIVLAALACAALRTSADAQSPAPLRVIRSSPERTAAPTDQITVTFDRPVAGSLDQSVDASKILQVAPAIAGRI
jgi:hypothetical protein